MQLSGKMSDSAARRYNKKSHLVVLAASRNQDGMTITMMATRKKLSLSDRLFRLFVLKPQLQWMRFQHWLSQKRPRR
jgi:hypothetical protein